MLKPLLCISLLLPAALSCSGQNPIENQGAWFKGNTHTHTLWSDGDGAPEVSVAWYRENDYQFLVLSDHNIFQDQERWFPVSEDGKKRLKPAELGQLIEQFGADAVQIREVDGQREMLLLTLSELKERFESNGEFLLIPGEEVTGSYKKHPVHINAVNIAEVIPALQGDSVSDQMNKTMDAIVAHGHEHGLSTLAHLNHPNFGWGFTWEEVASMRADRFFEVYNGHQGVRNHGDAEHASTEEIWDRANMLRMTELDLPPLFGLATDDAHNYHGAITSQSGRGWIMVRSESLESNAIVEAMKRGDFYASSGVTLVDVQRGDSEYRIEIDAQEGVQYTTQFIGGEVIGEGLNDAGKVLFKTNDNPAIYAYSGKELYVRAVVTSSKDHPNPYAAGDKETAWTQPIEVASKP
ncbi:MAG: hypothetical protein GY747_05310 [Planctomycetes bacterium]|nr:hypothetical protein [Planctomycetota bacterium]MCP4770733.1 hypothetical protein [Planctomycetota bacterium]MCP4861966.1 hypothetical protein [Planctomycetota bacterium]